MDFSPEHYFQTATQRMRQAQYLYQEGSSFALAIYVGGVAVECLLRAFKGLRNPTFDEKHDLLRLFAAKGSDAMARLKSPLPRKLERILLQRFPPPATVKLEDHDGII